MYDRSGCSKAEYLDSNDISPGRVLGGAIGTSGIPCDRSSGERLKLKILEFRGKYRFLSNFYPVEIFVSGEPYITLEHAYQASKTLDKRSRMKIQNTPTPGQAKRLGRTVPLRPGWDEMKVQVMKKLLGQKFDRKTHPKLADLLVQTYPAELIHGNDWGDHFWGMTQTISGEWVGKDMLGKLLMQIRKEIQ